MAAGIHRYGYTSVRPVTPNLTEDPLGTAPGATVNVFLTGLPSLASLFTDPTLLNPLANPFVSDANGWYSYYADPTNGDLDEQISGLGILTPYTLPSVLSLDPRIGSSSTTVAALSAQLTAEINARQLADIAITQAGVAYGLGGSLLNGIEDASQVPAYDRQVIQINGSLFAGYTATAVITVYTGDAGTSVQAIIRNLTTAANVGSSTPSTALTPTVVTFTFPLATGINRYELELLASNGNAFIYGSGYVQLTKP